MLTDDDLAYMRETQALHRPVQANLVPRTETPDGMGGTDTADGQAVPIAIRVAASDEVPQVLADRYGVGVCTIVTDLVAITQGDAITVTATEAYEVVSDGPIGTWQTAQVVYAVRTLWPAGEA